MSVMTGKKVFLELDGMKEGHVVYVQLPFYWNSEAGNELWSTEAWYTMNSIPENAMGTKTAAPAPIAVNTLSEAEKSSGLEAPFRWKNNKRLAQFPQGNHWQRLDY